jgi:uncharacterized caspase-like protein
MMAVFRTGLVLAALAFLGGIGHAVASGPAQGQSAGPRLALVIGNDDYRELPQLAGAVSDATAVADALKARGFKVTQASNLQRDAMLTLVSEFERSLARGGGVGVFFYAGQAAHVAGEDVMFPVDTRVASGPQMLEQGIQLAQIQKEIKSWRDNGTVTLYAASKGQTAFDSLPGQKNSLFTSAFLRALTKRGDDLQALFQGVREGVEAAFRAPTLSSFKQTPDISGQLRGPFFFNQADRDPAGSVTRIVIFDASRDNPFAAAPSR